jgi:hypothetical protein
MCFLNGEFTFTYTILNLSIEVSIGTIGPSSLAHNIININQINYLLHLLLITLRWGWPVPFTLQLVLQEGLSLEKYRKGSYTPTSSHPLGAHP